jgi:2-polyprenyl-3-methyl-5-hydroxy-6-metoxy-1,4-benzoquinol methylase
MHICGSNKQFGRKRTPYSYYFSKYNFIWGWASWRRAWKFYDVDMKTWPYHRDNGFLASLCEDPQEQQYWTRLFDTAFHKEVDTWDYQWTYACWANNGLSIVPNVNLITNVGFGEDATHTKRESIASYMPSRDLWDISHPPIMARHSIADLYTYHLFFEKPRPKVCETFQSLQAELHITQENLRHKDQLFQEQSYELEKLKKRNCRLRAQLDDTETLISEIQKSKFWKLRNIWHNVRTLGGLRSSTTKIDEPDAGLDVNASLLDNGLPASPLTGRMNVKLLRAYRTDDLIQRWKRAFEMDITDELHHHPYLYLFQCNDTGLKFFTPTDIVGSGHLYEQLEKYDWYYMPRKWEHDVAIPDLAHCKSVLEVGCGRGAFVKRLRDEYHIDAEGIELNSKAVRQAMEQDIPVMQVDLHELAHKQPESFDAICSFQVLEHVPDPKEFIASMIRLVKPNGKIILAVPNADTFTKYAYLDLLDQPPHHITRWDRSVFQKLTTLLPIKVRNFKFEPLAEYHIDWYYSIQLERLPKTFIWRKQVSQFVDDSFKPLLRSNPYIRSMIRGHTLYVCFERIN